MAADLTFAIRARIAIWAAKTKFGKLKKVEVWQPDEDELRARFGGRRAVLKCWKCQKPKKDVEHPGHVCAGCRGAA
jgi:hypothetical protein